MYALKSLLPIQNQLETEKGRVSLLDQVVVEMMVFVVPTILFLIALFAFIWNEKKNKLPPGNMSLPLIGETLAFMKPHSPSTVGQFMETRIARYGKVFSSKLMGKSVIVSLNPELNRFVLRNEGRLFKQDFPPAFPKLVGKYGIPKMLGDEHKHMRSTVLDFVSGDRLRTVFLQDADHLAAKLIGSWKEGEVISAKQEATKFSLYIMVKKILSMKPDNPEIENLTIEYEAFLKGLDCIPIYMPGTIYWRALQSRDRIINIFKKEMEGRSRKDGDEGGVVKDDFLGWLMKNTDYSTEKICDFLLGVLFAGHDTTSRSISLLIYFLEQSPKVIQQLRKEHLQIAKSKEEQGEDSKLTWDDIKKMDFTRCVINEMLRLGNVVSFALRKAVADSEYKGYTIPEGCSVLINFAAVHLDSSLFEDPGSFNPWRWQSTSNIKVNNSFMPFGGGLRLCPGAELAKLEMTVFLHHLILKYDWEMAEPDHPKVVPFIEFSKGLPIIVRAISADL